MKSRYTRGWQRSIWITIRELIWQFANDWASRSRICRLVLNAILGDHGALLSKDCSTHSFERKLHPTNAKSGGLYSSRMLLSAAIPPMIHSRRALPMFMAFTVR
jgi:hypothetical protein